MDGTKMKRANACGFYCCCHRRRRQEKEAAGGGRSKGSLSMWEGHGTGDRLRVLTASVKRARPTGSANRACHLKFNNILIIFWISKLGETPALVSV